MDMKFEVSWLKHERDESKAKATFDMLVRSNQLSKEEAEWIRENAYHSSVSNLASKFLGRMSKGLWSFLGCLTTLLILGMLIYLFVTVIKNKNKEELRSEAEQKVAIEVQKKQRLDALIQRMREARKIGLTNGRVLNEESQSEHHDASLLYAKSSAEARKHEYFGTVQFSRTIFNGGLNKVYYIISRGTDPRRSSGFTLDTTSGEPFLSLMPLGYMAEKSGRVTEFYGTWNAYYQTNIGGNFLAKVTPESLQIQIFVEVDGKMIYDGRVLMNVTK